MAANDQNNIPDAELDILWQEMDEALAEIEPQPVPDPQEHEAFMNAMFDVVWDNFQQANPDWNPLDNLVFVNEEDEDDEDDEEDEDEELIRELERRRKKILDSLRSCKLEAWKRPGDHGDEPPSSASAPLLVL